jgi:hypothetical protein
MRSAGSRLAGAVALATVAILTLGSCSSLTFESFAQSAVRSKAETLLQFGKNVTAPEPASVAGAISFTRIGDADYAQLCVPFEADFQTMSESLIDNDPSKGWVDVFIADSRLDESLPAATEWKLGTAMRGQSVDAGAGQVFDFTQGYFKVDVSHLDPSGSREIEVVGEFRGQDLTNGVWLDAKGNPETSACATYDASTKG